MADTGVVPGGDASYLVSTAREFGWRVVWVPSAALQVSKGAWTVRVRFHPDRAFRDVKACGPGIGPEELTLPEVVDLLEHWGRRGCGVGEVAADVVNDLLDGDADGGWEDDDSYDWTR